MKESMMPLQSYPLRSDKKDSLSLFGGSKEYDISKTVLIGNPLKIDDVTAVAFNRVRVDLDPEARERVDINEIRAQDLVQSGQVLVYGWNTGVGEQKGKEIVINPDVIARAQLGLLKTHAVGYGKPFPSEVVRAMLLLRAQTLSQGYSAVRPEVVETIIKLLNKDVIPCVPYGGSIGASGDLAPLAAMALPIFGEGEIIDTFGKRLPAKQALEEADIQVLQPSDRDGLALINGTSCMTALAAINYSVAFNLFQTSLAIASLSLEAQQGSPSPFAPEIQDLRPYPEQAEIAASIRMLTQNSTFLDPKALQSPYSLRSIPQQMGSDLRSFNEAEERIETEINSVTDNPVFDPLNNRFISGANFQGSWIARPMDTLRAVLAAEAAMSKSRTEILINDRYNNGLNAFLTAASDSAQNGLMILTYAQASAVTEMIAKSFPTNVLSADPVSLGQEDFNSKATVSSILLTEILPLYAAVLARELFTAYTAINYRFRQNPDLKLGQGTQAILELLRRSGLPFVDDDLLMDRVYLDQLEQLIINKGVLLAVKQAF